MRSLLLCLILLWTAQARGEDEHPKILSAGFVMSGADNAAFAGFQGRFARSLSDSSLLFGAQFQAMQDANIFNVHQGSATTVHVLIVHEALPRDRHLFLDMVGGLGIVHTETYAHPEAILDEPTSHTGPSGLVELDAGIRFIGPFAIGFGLGMAAAQSPMVYFNSQMVLKLR